MTNLDILEYDTTELLHCTEDWETVKECSQILNRLAEIEAGDEPIVASEIRGYRERINTLLNRP